ncbi:MAG: hypothetical protein KDE31_28040, partial [Caldilineaceae bacterium]|nr:hypothetical protein [Caldilineaceae bacterium]
YNYFLYQADKFTTGQGQADELWRALLFRAFTGELTAEWEATHVDLVAEEVARLERRPRLALLALVAQQQARDAAPVGITSLMKYTFLAQQEGQTLRQAVNHLYDFVPYHFGPFTTDVYTDLEALEAESWLSVRHASDDDPDAPERIEISLSPERVEEVVEAVAELSAAERADLEAVISQYGDLTHNELLDVVYEKYPAYAKKSRWRK